jgi:hypothetical protein
LEFPPKSGDEDSAGSYFTPRLMPFTSSMNGRSRRTALGEVRALIDEPFEAPQERRELLEQSGREARDGEERDEPDE